MGNNMSCKVITIAQQKGGSGKTTMACHLAVAFNQRGKRVTAIDIDPQGSFTRWHQIREEKLGEDYTGMNFVTISGWRLQNEINMVKNNSDIIIIDSPPHTQTETKTAIRAADIVIIPAQPTPTDLWATEETIKIVTNERIPHRILLNRVVQNSNLYKEISCKFPSLLESKIGNRISFAGAMADGKTATEVFSKSLASQEIKNISKEILDLVMPEQIKEEAAA